MKDFECKLLEQYCVDVKSTRKLRGGFFCDTEQGNFKLKELSSSPKKIPYVYYLSEQLKESGFTQIDSIILDKNGNAVCGVHDFGNYILKQWYVGRECDINKEKEVVEAARTLAKLHNHLDLVSGQINKMQEDLLYDKRWDYFIKEPLTDEWERHNQELKKVRRYVRTRVNKGEFEYVYLQLFDEIYNLAEMITMRLADSGYQQLYEASVRCRKLAHGDYNYHNIMMAGPQMAITNFEKFHIDIQINDLYYFLRKIMEKKSWDISMGQKIIYGYDRIRPIDQVEREYIALRLTYPEKFWKTTNCYYNTNKALISPKNVEKLRISIEQMAIKREFVQRIFAFHF